MYRITVMVKPKGAVVVTLLIYELFINYEGTICKYIMTTVHMVVLEILVGFISFIPASIAGGI